MDLHSYLSDVESILCGKTFCSSDAPLKLILEYPNENVHLASMTSDISAALACFQFILCFLHHGMLIYFWKEMFVFHIQIF